MKKYAATIKIALLIAAAVILFQMISLLSLYQYVRTDLYLSLVAVCFLTAGLLIARRTGARPLHGTAATATFPERSVTTAFPERFVMSAVPEKVAPQRPVLATLLTQRSYRSCNTSPKAKPIKRSPPSILLRSAPSRPTLTTFTPSWRSATGCRPGLSIPK